LGVARSSDLVDLLGDAWPAVLEHVSEAVLVLDSQRNLHFVNARARRLLGYEDGQQIGSRCRLTTRGVDCENACPLTFALERSLERVEDFATVYTAKDGRPLPLKVTVIPLRSPDGAFRGAIEILRPREPDPGFLLAGRCERVAALRRRVVEAARTHAHLVLVGDPPSCVDVARAIHRLSGVAESLFHTWSGSWDTVPPWPPGTMFAVGEAAASVLEAPPPAGWRVIAGVSRAADWQLRTALDHERIEIPRADELADDLPLIVAAWVRQLSPGLGIEAPALERLARMARELGFARLQSVLHAAVAAAGERLDETHLPTAGYGTAWVDDVLREPDPLMALERRVLNEVLERCGWRMQEAADRLGISRVTLWRKLKDHGIERPGNGGDK
jgi:PAS domain S-box-containing protein